MRWPTASDVGYLRSREGNRSRFFLGVQRGKERTSGCGTALYVGCHHQLQAANTYDANEHYLSIGLAGTDIRPGMTLACGTLADPFLYGSARIRYVDTTLNRLHLEPNDLFTLGHLSLGEYVWVDGVYRLYRKLPYIRAGLRHEDGNPTSTPAAGNLGFGIGYDARYEDRPVALMGSPRFAWAGEAINFYGWRSFGRGGNTVNAWAWSFDGGAVGGAGATAAGTPSSPVTATWSAAGEYNVSLTVTDDNASGVANRHQPDFYGLPFYQHRAVRPVLVYDRPGQGDNPPYADFEVRSLRGRYGSGWTASITVFGTADKSEFPDNALVILFCEDWYGGVQRQMGGWYGQEGILFVGYVRADSVVANAETSSVTFEAQSIEQWMKDIDIWPGNFEDSGAPGRWHQFTSNMVCEDILWYLAEISSNLKDVADCFFASDVGATKKINFLDLTEASLYDQMSGQLGSCFFGQLSASRQGSVHLAKHKNMLDLVERTRYGPPIYVFDKRDWRDDLGIDEERQRDSVAQVDFIGFYYDGNGNAQEVYSLAPGRQRCFGMIEKVTGILLTNPAATAQIECNTLSGLYLAWKNIRFPCVRVPAFNNRFLEPATLDYFGLNVAAADTFRGYVWSGKEFLCTEVAYHIDVEKGILLADVTGEASTWGPDGVSGEYPSRLPDLGDNPPEGGGEYPETTPPFGQDPEEGSGDWEPAAGAWVDDGGPAKVWKFFIYDGRLFAVAEPGDVARGLYERTGPATWTKRDPSGGVDDQVYEALVFHNRVWAATADNTIYSTIIPEVDGWILEWTCPAGEMFNTQRGITAYGGCLYVATEEKDDGTIRFINFHRYTPGGEWNEYFLPTYPDAQGPQVNAWDFVKYGWFWWSGYEDPGNGGNIFRYNNGGDDWDDYDDNLEAGKFTFCRGMYFASSSLDKIYLGTGGGWVEDYDPGDTINALISLSVEGDNVWIGAEIDAANLQVHTRWWGEEWRSILPPCADEWGGAAIRGPDGYVYLGGLAKIWRFVPA